MKQIPLVLLIAIFGATTACNSNGFSGSAKKGASAAPTSPGVPLDPPPPAVPSPPSPPPVSSTPTTPTAPTSPEIGSGSGSTSPLISIFDIIGGLIKIVTDVQIDQPSQTDIIFGGTKTFHIGDGDFDSSSACASQVSSYSLKGTRYFFEFEVLTDATTVTASIGMICGVDYDQSSSIYLQSSTDNLDQKPLTKGQTTADFAAKTLNIGKYTVVVESRGNANSNNDHDDFIVGQVKIHADKGIKPGKVGARP